MKMSLISSLKGTVTFLSVFLFMGDLSGGAITDLYRWPFFFPLVIMNIIIFLNMKIPGKKKIVSIFY